MIPQNVIDEILNRVSIVDIIGRFTEIRRNGRNAMALCPFHQEKSPSFSISEEKGLYHCFGCGASGNTIKFLIDHQKMTFLEAVRELAKAANIDLSVYENQQGFQNSKERERILKMNSEAVMFYHKNLGVSEALEAREYLKKRKLTLETIKTFRLGFGGKGWNALTDYLKQAGYTDDEIISGGLGTMGKRGVFDRFRERLLFPILDRDGNAVGFGGRILTEDKSAAKYLNTSETPVFHKGNLLFSLNFAKDEITREKLVLVAEGYMDVIGLYQNGIKNVVAPLGTALTESQLAILRRYAETVVFVFDGDSAGIKAANRALDIAVGCGMNQFVVILPDGKDPYDYVMEKGAEETAKYLLEKRLLPIDFKLRFLAGGLKQPADKVKFLAQLFPYLARIESAVVREEFLRKTAGFLKEDYGVIVAEYQSFLRHDKTMGRRISQAVKDKAAVNPVELAFIGLIGSRPEEVLEIEGILTPEMIRNPDIREIYEWILQDPQIEARELTPRITDERILRAVTGQAMAEQAKQNLGKEFAYKIKHLYIKREIERKSFEIAEAEKKGDFNHDKHLLNEKKALIEAAREAEEMIRGLEETE